MPIVEPQVKRTIAFFDGQNLFHAAKEAFGYPYPNYLLFLKSRGSLSGTSAVPVICSTVFIDGFQLGAFLFGERLVEAECAVSISSILSTTDRLDSPSFRKGSRHAFIQDGIGFYG